MKRSFWLFLGAVALVFLLWMLGLEKVFHALSSVSLSALIGLIALQVIALFLSTYALSFFLPLLPFPQLFTTICRSTLLSIVGPTATGEGSLLLLLRREGVSLKAASRAILLDRSVTVWTILLALCLSLVLFHLLSLPLTLLAGMLLVGILLALFALLASKERLPLLWNIGCTLLRALVWGLFYLAAFRAVGATQGSYLTFVLLPIAARLAGFIPIPGGLGVMEGSAAILFSLAHISPSTTVAAYLLARLAAFLGTALGTALPFKAGHSSRKLWEDRAEDYAVRTTHPPLPKTFLEPLKGETILDIGCGSGTFLPVLQGYAIHLFALDLSWNLLTKTIQAPQLSIIQADVKRIPLRKASVDCTFSYLVLCNMNINDRQSAWKEIVRIMKPRGKFLLVEANQNSFYFPFRKALEKLGLYSLGICEHTTVKRAQLEGRNVGLTLLKAQALPKPPSGSTPLRLALARLAARADRCVASFLPYWGGDLLLLFEKDDES